MIAEIAVCGTAAFLFGRGIYHSGVLSGWIVQGLSQPTPPPAPALPPAPPPNHIAEERREAEKFLAAPSAFWLDPNRWGDDPNWRERLGLVQIATPPPPVNVTVPIVVAPLPPCPNCRREGQAYIVVTAEHGGEASMWQCERCGCEFTRKGETRKSRQGRKARESGDYLDDMPPPPPAVVGSVYDDLPTSPYPRNACGCSGFETIEHHKVKGGGSWTRCGRCEQWWEPPSNDPKHRHLAQGEHVHSKDHMNPTARATWERVHRNGTQHHGVCPSYLCQMPVAKRDGKYYCTNTDCNHHYKGW